MPYCQPWKVCRYLLSVLPFLSVYNATHAKNVSGYVLRIQMTPAVCKLDKTQQKQRQCLDGYALTIAGLLPELTQPSCSTNSSAKLSTIQAKVVARIMPNETARIQLWQDIGGCVPMNASQYFRSMIGLAEKLKIPTVLSDGANRYVSAAQLKQDFYKLNNGLKPQSIRLNCQVTQSLTYLTEVQVCYKTDGKFKPCNPALLSNCPAEFNVQGGY